MDVDSLVSDYCKGLNTKVLHPLEYWDYVYTPISVKLKIPSDLNTGTVLLPFSDLVALEGSDSSGRAINAKFIQGGALTSFDVEGVSNFIATVPRDGGDYLRYFAFGGMMIAGFFVLSSGCRTFFDEFSVLIISVKRTKWRSVFGF